MIQIIIAVIIPVLMTVSGRRLRRNIPEYGSTGFAYKTRTAKLSEETWQYANMLFANMLFTVGINVGVVAALFLVVTAAATDANCWALAFILAAFEAASICLPVIVTNKLTIMNYDENGELRKAAKIKRKEANKK